MAPLYECTVTDNKHLSLGAERNLHFVRLNGEQKLASAVSPVYVSEYRRTFEL